MLILFIIFVFTMTVIQIAMFLALPKWIKLLMCLNKITGAVINFILSSVILAFTGVAVLAGISNLFASVLFGIFLYFYIKSIGRITYELKLPLLRITNKEGDIQIDNRSLSVYFHIEAENLK